MRLKHSFCNSENRIGSELLQVSEVSHRSCEFAYPGDYKALTEDPPLALVRIFPFSDGIFVKAPAEQVGCEMIYAASWILIFIPSLPYSLSHQNAIPYLMIFFVPRRFRPSAYFFSSICLSASLHAASRFPSSAYFSSITIPTLSGVWMEISL